jgi:hypothetical protein
MLGESLDVSTVPDRVLGPSLPPLLATTLPVFLEPRGMRNERKRRSLRSIPADCPRYAHHPLGPTVANTVHATNVSALSVCNGMGKSGATRSSFALECRGWKELCRTAMSKFNLIGRASTRSHNAAANGCLLRPG